ncbi:MAG TPA: transcriptional activator NhaR [Deltaproteobacteria bacterium]|nr:transcriptional activator NhaR [Deltaproteobacteria bacterium]HOI06648.1 transcriptional activator NhaR [Deltaproteobacteria bacterium]
MNWLNYHHLLYFWIVAREGSLAAASAELRLSQSAISGQIRALENSIGEKLFVKSGRRLMLSEAGRMVFRYADEIFTLGKELQETLKDGPMGRPLRVTVGVADVVPKLIARELIQPALLLPGPVTLVCREDKPDRLLAQLALHELDVILTDAPASTHVKVKAFNHLLGECDIFFLARPELTLHREGFPSSLAGAPVLLPSENTALRRTLDLWFREHDIRPKVMGEFEDNALLNVFGQMGVGLFPCPSLIVEKVMRQHQVEAIGRLTDVRQQFYAVTVDRRLVHPAAVAICQEARKLLHGEKQEG